MPYYRQLNLGEDKERELCNWFRTELEMHESERSEWIQKIKKLQSDYIAKPSQDVGTFPFKGASTIIVPITAIAVEAVHSRTMQTLFSLPQRASIDIKTDDTDLGPHLETYINQVLDHDIKFKESFEPAILELEKLGTGVATAEYIDTRKTGIRIDMEGNEEEFEVVIKQGPTIESVPIANYYQPFDEPDPQLARWCSKFFSITHQELKNRERDGFFRPGTYEKLHNWCEQGYRAANDYKGSLDELQNRSIIWPKMLNFHQVYTSFNVDDGDYDKEIVFVYHKESETICSIWYNWFLDLRRPFRKGNYFPIEFRWDGIGIAEQNRMFQYHMSTIHRQRLDNSTISNLRMFKVKRDADIKPDEPLYPGKFLFLDDMDDIQSLEMGDTKVSAYNNENIIQNFSQQRTGVNDLTLGLPQAGTPGTATDSMARVQESARKFDYSYANIRNFGSQLLQDTLCNIVQWGPNAQRIALIEKGNDVDNFLRTYPYEHFRNQVACSIELVGQNQNRFIDRQNMQTVSQLIEKYYVSMMQLAMNSGQQELVQAIAKQGMNAANKTLMQILQTFEWRDAEKYLFDLNSINGRPTIQSGTEEQNAQQIPPEGLSSFGGMAPDAEGILSQITG
jgi:hypothetical protein